ncbi:MAG TPA: hypothetical protein VMS17_19555 [Gemmataceae bacterium]|nr:hypothetical protein [Gemmataceae bacterium]
MAHLHFPHLLFAWFMDGHMYITVSAVSAAIATLDLRGVLARMGTGVTRMKLHLSALWAMDVCQDIDKGNILGMCGVDVPGGQVAHFMADSGQAKADAYKAAVDRIREESAHSWEWFRKGFPEKQPEHHHHGFFGGLLDAVAEYNPVTLAYKGAKEVVEEVEILDGARHLSRALHALQDSFSPAHTLRHGESLVIQEIFAWDPYNKGKHDDDKYYGGYWPGHHTMDMVHHNDLTRSLEQSAKEASRDLIVAVVGNLYDSGGFRSELNGVLARTMHKAW